MTFELRTYTAAPGRMEDLLQRFRDHTLALLESHGMLSVGYWLPVTDTHTLVYLLRHQGTPAENWARFSADPAWVKAKTESVRQGELVTRIESVFLEAVDFSPLQP